MKIFFVAAISILFAGCSTVAVIESNAPAEEKIGMVPALGLENSASVGEPIFSQFRYWSRTGYRIKDTYTSSLMLGRITVPAGEFLNKVAIDGSIAYCTEHNTYIDPLAGPLSTACFEDRTDSGIFTSVKARPGLVWFTNNIQGAVRYENSELIAPRADAFKYEILYQGISKGVLRLSYREYINDMARPSFFQDVSYDVASFPTEIAFKSVKIEILDSNNRGIRYMMQSGFR